MVRRSCPKGVPDWGTPVSPKEMGESGFPFDVMKKIEESMTPADPKNPDDWA